MKKLLPLIFVLSLGACRHSPPSVADSNARPEPATPAAPVAPAPVAVSVEALPSLFAAADTLTPAMREVLRHNDLSVLWQRPGKTIYHDQFNVFEGFFGPEHYHFALLLTQVARDANDPAVYHVAGKSRYFPSRSIRPFAGTFTVQQLAGLAYPGFLAAQARMNDRADDSLAGHLYTAHARLQLREAAAANSGIFEGEAVLDFYTVPGQKPGYVYVFAFEGTDDRLPTRGGGVLLRGNRRNVSTGQVKPFLVSPDIAAVAPFVFKDFLLDERMGQINPRYVRLGWQDYWTNEEWWAESPRPAPGI